MTLIRSARSSITARPKVKEQRSSIGIRIRNRRNEVNDHRSLIVAQDTVDFLTHYAREPGLFRMPGRLAVRRRILTTMIKGDRLTLKTLLKHESIIEIAAALQSYLQCLKHPILPTRVQQLLIADNHGISQEVIAADALGLLYQDLSGTHLKLITSLLDLFHYVQKNAHRTELTCFDLPIALLPTFFSIKFDIEEFFSQNPWSRKWHQVAVVLDEIITRAPEWKSRLERCISNEPKSTSSNEIVEGSRSPFRIFEPRPVQHNSIVVSS